MNQKTGIACMSGSFKAVFVHGVLSAFEAKNFSASVYGGCSASAIPVAYASIGKLHELNGVAYWLEGREMISQDEKSAGDFFFTDSQKWASGLTKHIFDSAAKELLISTSKVISDEGSSVTQDADKSRLIGRKLLIEAAQGVTGWRDDHLEEAIFTNRNSSNYRMTEKNLAEILYASTRMMHAWPMPATIDEAPFIDGSYTCQCPVDPVKDSGAETVIAILTEPGQQGVDYFNDEMLPEPSQNLIYIQPERDLSEIGVDFAVVTEKGLQEAFELGEESGRQFLTQIDRC